VADGAPPDAGEGPRIANAAVRYIAETASRLRLLPLEDALALEAQPNLPATVDEHPNWRRRYDGDAAALLETPDVRNRLAPLRKRAAS
jgi:4-alpha-glucanotransferase